MEPVTDVNGGYRNADLLNNDFDAITKIKNGGAIGLGGAATGVSKTGTTVAATSKGAGYCCLCHGFWCFRCCWLIFLLGLLLGALIAGLVTGLVLGGQVEGK